jgi:hypothetical protein
MSPEGAGRYGGNRLRTYGLDRVHSSPFRAKRLFRLTQGKPWAKFSCPFGAGRLTDAKQIPGTTGGNICIISSDLAKCASPVK